MAKVLASRAPSDDEAVHERLERAAARFSSIHDRWSAISSTSALELFGGESLLAAAASEADAPGELAPPNTDAGVYVTPILGIATEPEDEPRPRFKTLMGVPRDAPDVDEQSGLIPPACQEQRAPGGDSVATLERPTPPPLPAHLLSSPALGSRAEAAAALPARRTLPPALRAAPAHRAVASQSSAGLATELSALRRSQRGRSWLVGVASFALTLAAFAVLAPRERTLAVRWLLDEYELRARPSLHAVADTARALKPGSLVEPAGASSSPARGELTRGPASELAGIEEGPTAKSQLDPEIDMPEATAAPAAEVARRPRSMPPTESVSRPPAKESLSVVTDAPSDGSAVLPRRTVQRNGVAASRSKAQVAAPRQRSTRAPSAKASPDVKPRAARSTKERSTRQNSPRRAGNSGIIRETPF